MIRRAAVEDAPQLLLLMRKLAEFEGYADRFAVTVRDLIERGLADDESAEFKAWVVDNNGALHGYAVAYSIPFTFDLRPTVVLKELFIEEGVRGRRYGDELFTAVLRYTQSINARLLRWQLLSNNESAKRFYRRHDGELDSKWESWVLAAN